MPLAPWIVWICTCKQNIGFILCLTQLCFNIILYKVYLSIICLTAERSFIKINNWIIQALRSLIKTHIVLFSLILWEILIIIKLNFSFRVKIAEYAGERELWFSGGIQFLIQIAISVLHKWTPFYTVRIRRFVEIYHTRVFGAKNQLNRSDVSSRGTQICHAPAVTWQ
jgi:hypothetical protein